MNDRLQDYILSSLAIAAIFSLAFKLRQHRPSAEVLGQIRHAVENNVAETRAMHHTLRRQRGAINDIREYLIPVSKGVRQPTL